jgi:hypothetical protein
VDIAGLPAARSTPTAAATAATAATVAAAAAATTTGHLFSFTAIAAVLTARGGRKSFGAEKLLLPFSEGKLTITIGTIEGLI